MKIRPIRYYLSKENEYSGRATYSLGVLFEGIGLPLVAVNSISEADLVYSVERPNGFCRDSLWLQCAATGDWDAVNPPIFWSEGIPWLGRECNTTPLRGDILYSTYALLTGAFETPESKDQWGVPIAHGSLYESIGLLQFPWISKYCDELYRLLCQSLGMELDKVPRWPDKKPYAIVLSHDVDAPLSFIDNDFRRKWLRKLLSEKRYSELARGAAGYLTTATKKVIGHIPNADRDPNFCFESWIEIERKLNSKSGFYVATTTSADEYGDVRDVNYLYSRPDIVQALRRSVDLGWEIGLHGSINAWRDENRILAERAALQSVVGDDVITGVRTHFWSLDNQVPERTLAMHARAGFKYDSSLGLNDAPGYRRGIAWPFNPYDKSGETTLPIIEVPPTIMDGGVFYRELTPAQGKQEILHHVKRTFEAGGAVVINWHLEQLNPLRLRRAGPTLVDALLELSHDSEIYWASPSEMCEWWTTRREWLANCSL
jgi:hypothetical protein